MAFAAIVERDGTMFLGICWRILRDAHEAMDAARAKSVVQPR